MRMLSTLEKKSAKSMASYSYDCQKAPRKCLHRHPKCLLIWFELIEKSNNIEEFGKKCQQKAMPDLFLRMNRMFHVDVCTDTLNAL